MDSLESTDDPSERPRPSSTVYGLTRPIATYSPMGAADSGYQTDSPRPATASIGSGSFTPPPGMFRPVSPAEADSIIQLRHHVSTQTSRHGDEPQPLPPPPSSPPPPLLSSQQSTGFRPSSAPAFDVASSLGVGAFGFGGVVGAEAGAGAGSRGDNSEAELEPDFDEEVYMTSALYQHVAQKPLPDLLQPRCHGRSPGDNSRMLSRSVPVPDFATRQERVALLLREIGDQYNLSRGQPPAAAAAAAAAAATGGNIFYYMRRERRMSLRVVSGVNDSTSELNADNSSRTSWRRSLIAMVTSMARTLSGANIAQEDSDDEVDEGRAGEDD